MCIHERLTRIPKQDLRQLGWSKAAELTRVARKDGEDFDSATWLHKAKSLPKEGFKSEVERHLTGKELIAVRVSQHLNSIYAIRAHTISARQKGASEPQVEGVANFETGPYSEKEKLGFRLADRLHRGPEAVDDAFYSSLKSGFTDTELIELFLTAAAFEMFPRFIDGLHIPVTPPPVLK
jgi:AhpD family alkylhydroperoxidase